MKKVWQVVLIVWIGFMLLTSCVSAKTLQSSSDHWAGTIQYSKYWNEMIVSLTYTGPESRIRSFKYMIDYNNRGTEIVETKELTTPFTYQRAIRLEYKRLKLPITITLKWNDQIENLIFEEEKK